MTAIEEHTHPAGATADPPAERAADLPRGRLVAVALVSAAVLLLQLVQTRVFSVMLWHHLTYLVVTFTLLGFAAGGAVLACRPAWLAGATSRRLALWSVLFGVTALLSYALITRVSPDTSRTAHTRMGIALAALHYAVLVVPMVFAGMTISLALADARGAMGKVYAWNMGGSALGCALYVPVLRWLGGEGALVCAAALAFAGAAGFRVHREGGRAAGRHLPAALAVLAAIASVAAPQLLFTIPIAPTKSMPLNMELQPDLAVEGTYWDPLARLDVIGPASDPAGRRTIYQDGDAPTILLMGNAQEHIDILAKEGLAYLLFTATAPRVLAIGIGGGLDILQAKAPRAYPDGSSVDFTGVEINATTVELMRERYRDATGDRYHLPGVTVHTDEGRSWLRRTDEKYDIIQMSGTDTYAALSSGSYVMSESYLYTAEAYDDFLDHLTPDGVISVMRFRFEPPRETLRLAAIAVDALRRDGARAPADHVILLGIEGQRVQLPDGREIGLDYGALLIRKRPFRAPEVDLYREYCAKVPRVFVMHAPGVATTGYVADYFAAVRANRDEEFRASYLFNLDPVTDDNPFFFRYHRWGNVWNHLLGPPRTGSDAYLGLVGGEPIALIMLVTVLAESTILAILLVLVPLVLFHREGLRVRGAGRWVCYFCGLGAGYILVEIVAMQRFVLFLGHPGYAITVVLLTFLLFSALGARLSGRSRDPRRTLVRALVLVVLLIGLLNVGLPPFFARALLLPLPARIALSIAVLAPLAFVMGMPFPSGLALASRHAAALVPWAFGVNGGASVIASVAGILLAMASGFSTAFLVAGGAYLLALIAGLKTPGARSPAP